MENINKKTYWKKLFLLNDFFVSQLLSIVAAAKDGNASCKQHRLGNYGCLRKRQLKKITAFQLKLVEPQKKELFLMWNNVPMFRWQ